MEGLAGSCVSCDARRGHSGRSDFDEALTSGRRRLNEVLRPTRASQNNVRARRRAALPLLDGGVLDEPLVRQSLGFPYAGRAGVWLAGISPRNQLNQRRDLKAKMLDRCSSRSAPTRHATRPSPPSSSRAARRRSSSSPLEERTAPPPTTAFQRSFPTLASRPATRSSCTRACSGASGQGDDRARLQHALVVVRLPPRLTHVATSSLSRLPNFYYVLIPTLLPQPSTGASSIVAAGGGARARAARERAAAAARSCRGRRSCGR